MKLILRHRQTGKRIVKRFARWHDLLDEAWRVYFASLDWPGKLDCICEAGCDAVDEICLPTLNSQPKNSQLPR